MRLERSLHRIMLGTQSSPLPRGTAFMLLDHGFMNYTVPDTGQSLYESIAPEMIIALDPHPTTTLASEVTLRGTVSPTPVAVFANNVRASVTGDAFVVTVPLAVGRNSIAITAYDELGIPGTTTIEIVRGEPLPPPPPPPGPEITDAYCVNAGAGKIHCYIETKRATQVEAWLDISEERCEHSPGVCRRFADDLLIEFEAVFTLGAGDPIPKTAYAVAVDETGRKSPVISVPVPPESD